MDDESNVSNSQFLIEIEDKIVEKKQIKQTLISQFKYLEADKLQLEISNLEKRKEQQDIQLIESNYLNEFQELDNQFTYEMDLLIVEFQKKIEELHLLSKKLEVELNQKHKSELEDYKSSLNKNSKFKLKNDSEINELRKIEEHLVKSNKLKEAHSIKLKREKLEKQNEIEFNQLNSSSKIVDHKIQSQTEKLNKIQQNEKEFLKSRILREMDKIKMEKNKALEKLHLVFKNKKKLLENQLKRDKNIILKSQLDSRKISNEKTTQLQNGNRKISFDNLNESSKSFSKIHKKLPNKISVNLKHINRSASTMKM